MDIRLGSPSLINVNKSQFSISVKLVLLTPQGCPRGIADGEGGGEGAVFISLLETGKHKAHGRGSHARSPMKVPS